MKLPSFCTHPCASWRSGLFCWSAKLCWSFTGKKQVQNLPNNGSEWSPIFKCNIFCYFIAFLWENSICLACSSVLNARINHFLLTLSLTCFTYFMLFMKMFIYWFMVCFILLLHHVWVQGCLIMLSNVLNSVF